MLTGRKLLLADDSVTIQKVVDLTFGDEGMQVTTVSDGEQALAKLEEINPDIVLADIHMPKLGGYDVCERIKHDERFRHLPVMLLVGSFEPFDEEEARRVGADDHLTKPFQSIRQLVNKVSSLLGGGAPEEEAATQRLPSLVETEERPAQEARAVEHVMNAEALEVATANTAPLPPQPHSEAQAAEAETIQAHAETMPQAQEDEAPQPFSLEESHAPAYAPAGAGPQMNFGARTDDALLDLGEIEPAYSASREDDFILDLQDEAFYSQPHTLVTDEVEEAVAPAESEDTLLPVQLEEEMTEASPRAEEFTEAQFAGEEQRAEFAPTEEAFEPSQTLEPPHVSAEPLTFDEGSTYESGPLTQDASTGASEMFVAQEAPPAPAATAQAGQIGLDQLSPEVIDAIARRAVEHLSERVVQEIAWEVVPQLAELLIKRRLEEEKSQPR
ncbi:MAG TPA: response regulator [Pyrinomonadaceae bacterium]|nr:response regulator [Pyrinomonadaceae bacterium]